MIPQAAGAATGAEGFFHTSTGRLLDTRTTDGPWTTGTWHTVTPNGQLGLPTSGLTALSVTLSSTASTAYGYVTALPASAAQVHTTSMLQWNATETVSNAAVIATDDNGAFQVYVSASTQLVIDVQGYFSTSSSGSAPGGFTALPNGGSRLYDSRSSASPNGTINPGATYTISGSTASNGVPAGTATSLFANITVISHVDHDSNVTAWPAGTTRPSTTLDFVGNNITAIGTVIGVNSAGQFNLYLSSGAGSPVDVIVDVQGYYTSASTPGGFTAVDSRLYDSRSDTQFTMNSVRKVQVSALGGVPSTVSGVAVELVNVKLISHNASDYGYLRIWGSNQAEPSISDINVNAGEIRSNLITVVPGTDNSVWVRYLGGTSAPVDVVVDAEGWYANSSVSTVPEAPQSVTASATDSTAQVSFAPPASDGGAAITSYTVTANPNGKTATATGSPIVFTGLTNGTAYTFTVAATNSAGTGPFSSVSNVVTPHAIANTPGAPQTVGATASDASATVTFTAPTSNGGAAITSYKVTSTPGGKTASGSGSPITVTGLTNNTVYTFTVTATNSAGTGPASTPSRRVTPQSTTSNNYPCLSANHCWGVDTVDKIDKNALDAINTKWGRQPDFVGQYLNFRDTNYTVSFDSGLASTLHTNNVGIMMIQDEGYCSSADKGTKYADDANSAALNAKAPPNHGIYIFMDIEINDTVTDTCISAYVTQLEKHGFEAGFYENPLNGSFPTQYCQAVANTAAVKADTYLWSSTPSGNDKSTTAALSPTFNPNKPSCTNNTTAWQYALAAGSSFNYDQDEIAPDRRAMLY